MFKQSFSCCNESEDCLFTLNEQTIQSTVSISGNIFGVLNTLVNDVSITLESEEIFVPAGSTVDVITYAWDTTYQRMFLA